MDQITRRTMLQRFRLDGVKHVTGTPFTRISLFYDDQVVAPYGRSARCLYAGLA